MSGVKDHKVTHHEVPLEILVVRLAVEIAFRFGIV